MKIVEEQWVDVKLGGYLGKRFGRNHRFLVSTTKEIVRALCFQVKGFREALEDSEKKGIKFAVFNGKHNISDKAEFEFKAKNLFRIIPIVAGSKRAGLFQIVLGVVLLVVGFFTGGSTYPYAFALLAGGVAQLLSPQPQGLKTKTDSENLASYAFGGPVNTTAQGTPIGILYGTREVGGSVISAGIAAEDQA